MLYEKNIGTGRR